jgi:hypothetical protein
MRKWIPIALLAALTAFAGISPSVQAQPVPPPPPPGRRLEPRPPPPGVMVRPPPPGVGFRPGPPAPVVFDYRAHFVQYQDQWRLHRRELRHDLRAWRAGRLERAAEERHAIAYAWGDLVTRPEAHAELVLHAERMARLNRILDVAEDEGNEALAGHCRAVIAREIARNARVMQDLRIRIGMP